MKYYMYRQNNSGGEFDINEDLAVYVIVEARDEDEANEIAFSKGIYFDGVDNGIDCECCGDRWYHPTEYDTLEAAKKITKNQINKKYECRIHLNRNKVELDKDLFEI